MCRCTSRSRRFEGPSYSEDEDNTVLCTYKKYSPHDTVPNRSKLEYSPHKTSAMTLILISGMPQQLIQFSSRAYCDHINERIMLNVFHRNMTQENGLDSFGPEQGPVESSCEKDNVHSSSIKCKKFLYHLQDSQ